MSSKKLKLRMHIGLLTSELGHDSGWADYSLNLIEALDQIGARVTVVAARNNTQAIAAPLHNLLPTVAPPDRNTILKMLSLRGEVRSVLKSCDVIHTTIEAYAPLANWVAGHRPFFITGHGTYVRIPQMRKFPVNKLYQKAFLRSRMICVSHYTAKVAREVVPGLRTAVVNNAIDPERFRHMPVTAEQEHPTIVTVGGIKGRKGTMQLIRAVGQVRNHLPDVQCVVIGSTESEPKYVAQVKAEIERFSLQNNVKLLGHIPEDELIGWYGMADVFVLPSMNIGSKFEGFGIALLEASAAGCPVIGTRDCGAEDAIVDGETGLLVSQRNVNEELPQAIIKILTDAELAKRLGKAGRQRALKQTWFAVAKHMMTQYESGKYG